MVYKGKLPKKSYLGRKSVAYSAFVAYGSGGLFVTKPSWFNYETTISSIREFIAAANLKCNEKIILICSVAQKSETSDRE